MLVLFAAAVAIQLPATAMRLDTLLKIASTQSHETMRTGGTMGSHIVLVDTKPLEAKDLRKALAAANFGKWRQSGTEWIIDLDTVRVAAQQASLRKETIDAIRMAQKQMVEEEEPPLSSSDVAKKLEELEKSLPTGGAGLFAYSRATNPILNRSPLQVAFRHVIARIDPESLNPDFPTVFTSRPNRLQKKLPDNAASEIDAFIKAQSSWVTEHPTADPHGRWQRNDNDPRTSVTPPPPGGLRLFMSVSAGKVNALFSCSLVDTSGAVRYRATISLSYANSKKSDPTADQPNDPPAIPVAEESVRLSKAFAVSSFNRDLSAVTPGVRSRILDPTRFEPLDLFGGETVRLYQKLENSDLVAWIPDSAFRDLPKTSPAGTTTAAEVRRAIQLHMHAERNGEKLIVWPKEPTPNLDRNALKTFLNQADRFGYVSLSNLLEFAASGAYANPFFLVDPILEAVLPRSTTLLGHPDPRMISILASIPPAKLKALFSGSALEWNSLPTAAKDAVEAMVLSVNRLNGAAVPGGTFGSINSEPTELLGSGEGSISLTGSMEAEDGLLAYGTPNEVGQDLGFSRLGTIAEGLVSQQRGQMMPFALPKGMDRFVPGQLRTLQLVVNLRPEVTSKRSFQIGEFDVRQGGVALDALPDPTRKLLAQYIEQVTQSRNRARPTTVP